jgi:hypothetical protein
MVLEGQNSWVNSSHLGPMAHATLMRLKKKIKCLIWMLNSLGIAKYIINRRVVYLF